jgi:hypothetical protein
MRIKLMVASLLVFLLVVGSAQAFTYHLSYGQAKHATKEVAQEFCAHAAECSGYGVGACNRVSESRIDCVMAQFYPGREPGEEVECNTVLHWGVSRQGFVELKRHGQPHCFPV